MGQNHENHRKETHSPSVAKSSTGNSCKFVDLSESDVQTFIQEQSNKGTLKKTLCDVKKFENFINQRMSTVKCQNWSRKSWIII